MDGVFCFGWERLEILHFDPWGKKPKKIAFYPKKMVHEGLNHSIILTPTSSSRNEHIALLCLLFNVFLTDNFELGLILDGYNPFGE